MFFLPWWTYVLVGTVAFTGSLAAVWLANRGELGVEQPDGDPYPCGQHLGTDEDGAEDWCWQITGHPGEHLGMRQDWSGLVFEREWPKEENDGIFRQKNAAGDVVIDENPGYLSADPEPVCFTTMSGVTTTVDADGTLPQRLSKIPNQPWPGCFHQSSEGRCRLVKSHIGSHEYI